MHLLVSHFKDLLAVLSQESIYRSGLSPQSGGKMSSEHKMPGHEPMRCLPIARKVLKFRAVCTQRMSPLLCPEPFTGSLVVVVWWDKFTLISVQYQTKLDNSTRMELNLNLALAGTYAELGYEIVLNK